MLWFTLARRQDDGCWRTAVDAYQSGQTHLNLWAATRDPQAIEQAIAAFKFALGCFIGDQWPGLWQAVHHGLWEAYAQRPTGEPRDNAERALAHLRAMQWFAPTLP